MRVSEFKEPEPRKAVKVDDLWVEADPDEYLSWPASKRWRYCFSRDMYNARHASSTSEAEWYRNRAARYLEEAKQASIQEREIAAKSSSYRIHIG